MTEKKNLNRWTSLKDSLWCLGGINRCTSNLLLQDTLIIYSGGLTEAINEIENFLEKKLVENSLKIQTYHRKILERKYLPKSAPLPGKQKLMMTLPLPLSNALLYKDIDEIKNI